jgi:hypothetical protein
VTYRTRPAADGGHEVRVIGENGEDLSEPYHVASGPDGRRIVRIPSGERRGPYDVNHDQSDFTVSASDGTVRQTRAYSSDSGAGSQGSQDWTYIPR